ncbi:phospholipid carrier-dependent glycosyltransferase [Bacillus salipaludis]|uniref:Phospholipid carrier-dependent glycosyltransferase n=1 Tax=Bacillus salipaludis TaxID=2547811 RepID=A0A4R5VI66_9BACI|nr:glycosyltransferase family 39 protein [Bacillus salipaludis]TDK55418.1 phospholipid carrier-dependent glycosyltransferase [Bacillus salipaludis]
MMEKTNQSEPLQTSNMNVRGRPGNPPWERPALLTLLLLTVIAYIWGLGQSGWSNSFYSAAVQAGTKSWKAFFFGSIDASNFITVDKPPASLWIMELSARIFGLNSWSMLVPEALMGVACVWVLYLTIRRWFSAGAALIAGTVLAMTPVAALMFRFNNPDALLVLLLTTSAYAFTRALEEGKTKWLVWASVFIGFGFLTKMMAAFLIIPVFVVVYLLFAPVSVRRRLVQMVISAITVVVSAGWWVAIVQLVPAANRPYIGSSQKNSILDLIFGYNGLGRLTGNESGMGSPKAATGVSTANDMVNQAANMGRPGGAMGGSFSGSTGLTRLFNSEMGGQISWLIPAALILLIVAVWLVRRNWKSDRTIPAMLLWAGTFFVTGIVFSYSAGTIHPYYTVALAPAIGAIIGIGVEVLWTRREQLAARLGLTATIAATAVWSYILLDRTSTWYPWLRVATLVIGLVAAITMMIAPKLRRNLMMGAAAAGLAACLAGPFAYTVQTIATPHTGSMPSAGPSTGGDGFPGRFGGGQMPPGANSSNSSTGQSGNSGFGGQMSPGNNSGNSSTGQTGNSGFGGQMPPGNSSTNSSPGQSGFGGQMPPSSAGGTRNAKQGGPDDNATPGKNIVKLFKKDATKYTWVAATIGSQSSAPYQLATGAPIMDIGGFTGSDPTPTLAQFKKYVSDGKIHYFINSGRGGMGGGMSTDNTNGKTNGSTSNGNFQRGPMGGGSNSEITNWVQNNFKTTTVDGVTLYDLTQPKSK